MSGYSTHYSPEAMQDLAGIQDYISLEFANSEAALRITNKILDAVENLGEFPRSGAPLASITGIANPYRFIVVGKYMVFYRVEERDIYIDRVLYGRRDYFRVLFGALKDGKREE